MQILYAMVQERCQKNVLWLHNQTVLHAIAYEEVRLVGKPISLTEKKIIWPLPELTGGPHTYSNIASSAAGQPTQNKKSTILTLLQAYTWQRQEDDLERSSHLA